MQFRLIPHGSAAYRLCVDLRREILRLPLGLDFTEEQLQAEAADFHLGLFHFDQLIACCVLHPLDDRCVQMKQVAVQNDLQGIGIGRTLCWQAQEFARKTLGANEIVLHARHHVVPFYEKLGYKVEGEEYLEVGLPHRTMRRPLSADLQPLVAEHTPGTYQRATWPSCAILPLGAIEWHGEHLPLGTDQELAENFAAELGHSLGVKVFPTLTAAMTTLPHALSLQTRPETLRNCLLQYGRGILGQETQTLFILTGHYAQGHELVLYEIAEQLMGEFPKSVVLASSPLEILEEDALLDHAGRWETMQHSWQGLHLDRLPETPNPVENAVLGRDPRVPIDNELRTYYQAIRRWAEWKAWCQLTEGRDLVGAFYARRRETYRSYVERFYQGDWEKAIEAWWASLVPIAE